MKNRLVTGLAVVGWISAGAQTLQDRQEIEIATGTKFVTGADALVYNEEGCQVDQTICDRIRAEDLEAQVDRMATTFGVPIGTIQGATAAGRKVLDVEVYPRSGFPSARNGMYDDESRTVLLPEDWSDDAVWHEAAHDLLIDGVGKPDRDAVNATETLGVHEGLAYIAERIGGYTVESGFLLTIAHAEGFPQHVAATQIGLLLAKTYDRIVESTGDAEAVNAAFREIMKNFKHVDGDKGTALPIHGLRGH